jgi:hypothetical protein
MPRFVYEVRYVEASGKRTLQVWQGEATRVDTLLNEEGDPSMITVFDGSVPVFLVQANLFESGRVIEHLVSEGRILPLTSAE